MRYSITFTETDYDSLIDHILQPGSTEQAAYLVCSLSITASESRLLVKEVMPVVPAEIISASDRHMEIAPQSFMRAMKWADVQHLSFIFVHSHPDGTLGHSGQDDRTERSLFRTAYTRIRVHAVHASIVFSDINRPQARVWHVDQTTSRSKSSASLGIDSGFFNEIHG